MSYYEQPQYRPVTLLKFAKGKLYAEVLQLDEDAEYFCANTVKVDSDGYETIMNNTGSVSLTEAIQAFGWDLDLFFDGKELELDMGTEAYASLLEELNPQDS